MTWPFENDTSAIVKKLADRSMKADKRSKTFLLLTIALSVCMVFSIILISTGTQEEFKNTQRNKAQIGILGVTDEQTALLRQNKDISWIGEYSAIGFFYVDDKTITVAYGDEDYLLHQEEKTLQGSVPQKENEIMLLVFWTTQRKATDILFMSVKSLPEIWQKILFRLQHIQG